MAEIITIGVYRPGQSFSDESLALVAHNERRATLERLLAECSLETVDWGQTRDPTPHEFTQIVAEISQIASADTFLSSPYALAITTGALANLTSDAVKFLALKLLKAKGRREIGEFFVSNDKERLVVNEAGETELINLAPAPVNNRTHDIR